MPISPNFTEKQSHAKGSWDDVRLVGAAADREPWTNPHFVPKQPLVTERPPNLHIIPGSLEYRVAYGNSDSDDDWVGCCTDAAVIAC